MTGLEETFYIMAIIFMSLSFVILIALVTSVLVIRSKIIKIHEAVDEKLSAVTNFAEKGGELAGMASSTFKQAKRTFKKARK